MFQFFDKEADTSKRTGAFLPHWRQGGVLYFVTFRLADSLPHDKLEAFAQEKVEWLNRNPEPQTADQQAEYHARFTNRIQNWLDAGHGSMLLLDHDAKNLVTNALTHFDRDRYDLDAYVVAANHVHVLVSPLREQSLGSILQSWKGYTAKEILKLPVAKDLTTAPTVWQKEYWDHIVRSEASLEKFREYIQAHPA